MAGCQAPQVLSPLSFRAEVTKGTEGAIPCDSLQTRDRTIWLGPAVHFDLDYAGLLHGPGSTIVFYEIREEAQRRFGDFTERLSTGRMVIEVDGVIVEMKGVRGRQIGAGLIDGGHHGLSQAEAAEIVEILVNSIPKAKLEQP